MIESYRRLIESARVSDQTRTVLLERAKPDDPDYEPAAVTRAELATLRSVIARIIPQSVVPQGMIPATQEGMPIDIAARLDRTLAEGKGDGWRYADLPDDLAACRDGLRLLDECAMKLGRTSFGQMKEPAQDALLAGIAAGRINSPKLNLARWFEDLRAAATQIYVAHPETLAQLGYSGIADDPNGFVQLGIGQVEAWEPQRP